MSKYDKLKNDELKKLLTERGLSTAGKKADFIARLNELDESETTKTANGAADVTTSAPATAAASTTPSNSTPKDPVVKSDAPHTATTTTTAAGNANTPATTSHNESTDSSQLNDDREKKLAARAARFGIPKDEEAERKKARISRFGLQSESTPPSTPEDKPLSQPKSKSTQTVKEGGNKEGKRGPGVQAKVGEKRSVEKSSILDDPIEAEKAKKRALKYGTASVAVPNSVANY